MLVGARDRLQLVLGRLIAHHDEMPHLVIAGVGRLQPVADDGVEQVGIDRDGQEIADRVALGEADQDRRRLVGGDGRGGNGRGRDGGRSFGRLGHGGGPLGIPGGEETVMEGGTAAAGDQPHQRARPLRVERHRQQVGGDASRGPDLDREAGVREQGQSVGGEGGDAAGADQGEGVAPRGGGDGQPLGAEGVAGHAQPGNLEGGGGGAV